MPKGHVVMGLLFFPRGGSAQVARYLTTALIDADWSVDLVAGSLGAPGEETHAPTFFEGIALQYVDYTDALRGFERGESAIHAPVPMHPSYEYREDAPDVVLSAVPIELADHLASVWTEPFRRAAAHGASVFHLHHLTPQHDAVARHWPDAAIVAHLHGTEIKFLEEVNERAAAGVAIDHWQHGEAWRERLRAQAQRADHLIVVSPGDQATAVELLGIDAEHVTAVPNGVDVHRFSPREMPPDERRAHFRRWLVEQPQGWDETGAVGSVTYRETDLDQLLGPDGNAAILIYVGRFTSAKRVPLLVRAFARASARFERATSLLIWGGHPGECEDEHPVTVARSIGATNVFFAGWRGHDDLPVALAACDALVMSSVNDSYPQTPLEAMACGLPVIATTSGGFPLMVNVDPTQPTGWLVPPDDETAYAEALVQAVNTPGELERRGAAALAHARARLSWASLVPRFEDAYARAQERRAARS